MSCMQSGRYKDGSSGGFPSLGRSISRGTLRWQVLNVVPKIPGVFSAAVFMSRLRIPWGPRALRSQILLAAVISSASVTSGGLSVLYPPVFLDVLGIGDERLCGWRSGLSEHFLLFPSFDLTDYLFTRAKILKKLFKNCPENMHQIISKNYRSNIQN